MKRIFSILFASLILVSGLHISFARHFCNGEGEAFEKVSFSGELASCGMEQSSDSSNLPGVYFKSLCCEDEVSTLAVDNNYSPSFTVFKAFPQPVLQLIAITASFSIHSLYAVNYIGTNVRPPGYFLVSDVNLPGICVFRI